MAESILTENLEVLEMEQEIQEIKSEISQLTPIIKELSECLNHFSNKQARLLQQSRDKQKELRLLMKHYQKCLPHKTVKKSLNNKEPMSRDAIRKLLAAMPADMKAKLMEGLLK